MSRAGKGSDPYTHGFEPSSEQLLVNELQHMMEQEMVSMDNHSQHQQHQQPSVQRGSIHGHYPNAHYSDSVQRTPRSVQQPLFQHENTNGNSFNGHYLPQQHHVPRSPGQSQAGRSVGYRRKNSGGVLACLTPRLLDAPPEVTGTVESLLSFTPEPEVPSGYELRQSLQERKQLEAEAEINYPPERSVSDTLPRDPRESPLPSSAFQAAHPGSPFGRGLQQSHFDFPSTRLSYNDHSTTNFELDAKHDPGLHIDTVSYYPQQQQSAAAAASEIQATAATAAAAAAAEVENNQALLAAQSEIVQLKQQVAELEAEKVRLAASQGALSDDGKNGRDSPELVKKPKPSLAEKVMGQHDIPSFNKPQSRRLIFTFLFILVAFGGCLFIWQINRKHTKNFLNNLSVNTAVKALQEGQLMIQSLVMPCFFAISTLQTGFSAGMLTVNNESAIPGANLDVLLSAARVAESSVGFATGSHILNQAGPFNDTHSFVGMQGTQGKRRRWMFPNNVSLAVHREMSQASTRADNTRFTPAAAFWESERIDVQNRPWYKIVAQKFEARVANYTPGLEKQLQPYIWEDAYDFSSGGKGTTLGFGIVNYHLNAPEKKDKNPTLEAVGFCDLPLPKVGQTLQQIETLDGTLLFIMNEAGVLIATNEADSQGSLGKVAETHANPVIAKIASSVICKEESECEHALLDMVPETMSIDGTKYLVTIVHLEEEGGLEWILASTLSIDDLDREVLTLDLQSSSLLFIVGALCLLLAYQFSLLNPLVGDVLQYKQHKVRFHRQQAYQREKQLNAGESAEEMEQHLAQVEAEWLKHVDHESNPRLEMLREMAFPDEAEQGASMLKCSCRNLVSGRYAVKKLKLTSKSGRLSLLQTLFTLAIGFCLANMWRIWTNGANDFQFGTENSVLRVSQNLVTSAIQETLGKADKIVDMLETFQRRYPNFISDGGIPNTSSADTDALLGGLLAGFMYTRMEVGKDPKQLAPARTVFFATAQGRFHGVQAYLHKDSILLRSVVSDDSTANDPVCLFGNTGPQARCLEKCPLGLHHRRNCTGHYAVAGSGWQKTCDLQLQKTFWLEALAAAAAAGELSPFDEGEGNANQRIWTDFYRQPTEQTAILRLLPVLANTGELVGVWGVEVELGGFTQELSSLAAVASTHKAWAGLLLNQTQQDDEEQSFAVVSSGDSSLTKLSSSLIAALEPPRQDGRLKETVDSILDSAGGKIDSVADALFGTPTARPTAAPTAAPAPTPVYTNQGEGDEVAELQAWHSDALTLGQAASSQDPLVLSALNELISYNNKSQLNRYIVLDELPAKQRVATNTVTLPGSSVSIRFLMVMQRVQYIELNRNLFELALVISFCAFAILVNVLGYHLSRLSRWSHNTTAEDNFIDQLSAASPKNEVLADLVSEMQPLLRAYKRAARVELQGAADLSSTGDKEEDAAAEDELNMELGVQTLFESASGQSLIRKTIFTDVHKLWAYKLIYGSWGSKFLEFCLLTYVFTRLFEDIGQDGIRKTPVPLMILYLFLGTYIVIALVITLFYNHKWVPAFLSKHNYCPGHTVHYMATYDISNLQDAIGLGLLFMNAFDVCWTVFAGRTLEDYLPVRAPLFLILNKKVLRTGNLFLKTVSKAVSIGVLFGALLLALAAVAFVMFADTVNVYELEWGPNTFRSYFDSLLTLLSFVFGADNFGDTMYPSMGERGTYAIFWLVCAVVCLFCLTAMVLAIFQHEFSGLRKRIVAIDTVNIRMSLLAAFSLLDADQGGDLDYDEMSSFKVYLKEKSFEHARMCSCADRCRGKREHVWDTGEGVTSEVDKDSHQGVDMAMFLAELDALLANVKFPFQRRYLCKKKWDLIKMAESQEYQTLKTIACFTQLMFLCFHAFADSDLAVINGHRVDGVLFLLHAAFIVEFHVLLLIYGVNHYWNYARYRHDANFRQFGHRFEFVLVYASGFLFLLSFLNRYCNSAQFMFQSVTIQCDPNNSDVLGRLVYTLYVFRLITVITSCRRILVILGGIIPTFLPLLELYLVTVNFFAIIGMALFDHGWDGLGDDAPDGGFDTLSRAYILLFELLVGNNWSDTMNATIIKYGSSSMWYYLIYIMLCTTLFTNLFLGMLLEAFISFLQSEKKQLDLNQIASFHGASKMQMDAAIAAAREKILRQLQ